MTAGPDSHIAQAPRETSARQRPAIDTKPPVWSLGFIGLCIYTFAILTYKLPVGELGIAVAIFGVLLDRHHHLSIPLAVWLMLAYVLWAFAGTYVSAYPDLVISRSLDQLKLLIVLWLVVNVLRTKERIRYYSVLVIGCFILFPVRGALVNFFTGNTIWGRVVWNFVYSNPNDLAAYCLLAFGVALSVCLSPDVQRLVRLGAAVAAALLIQIVLMTQSRGAFLGLLVGMGPAALRAVRTRPTRVLAAIAAAILILLVTPNQVWQRLSGVTKLTSASTIVEADPEHSAEQRFEIAKVGWRIFIDHPFAGVGLGAYRIANGKYAPELGQRDTHNTYLNLAAELGVPGLLIWCAMVGSVFQVRSRVRARNGDSLSGLRLVWLERATVAFLVAGFFGTYSTISVVYIALGMLLSTAEFGPEPAHPNALRMQPRSQ